MGERGCGRRRPGMYLVCSMGPGGIPFENCLIDPPRLLPEGMNAQTLANKPALYGEYSEDAPHNLQRNTWVGEEHYP